MIFSSPARLAPPRRRHAPRPFRPSPAGRTARRPARPAGGNTCAVTCLSGRFSAA